MFVAFAMICILSLVIQALWVLRCIIKKDFSKFSYILLSEAISAVFMFCAAKYFDSLPGFGFMPGLTYLKHWLLSVCTGIGFGFLFLLSLIIICLHKNSKK